jgi:hypothetical protein
MKTVIDLDKKTITITDKAEVDFGPNWEAELGDAAAERGFMVDWARGPITWDTYHLLPLPKEGILEDDADTYGDTHNVPCPWCGLPQDLTDPFIDGVARDGYTFLCDDCQGRIKITAVDYDIAVYANKG